MQRPGRRRDHAGGATRPRLLRSARRPAAALTLAGVLLAGACEPGALTGPSEHVDVRPFVTGAAAANLDAGGLFTYAAPSAPSTEPIISPERARELAVSFALSFGPSLERYWAQEHGRDFDSSRLQAEPRVFYQNTPHGLFPEGFHGAFRRMFGPYYLVRLGSEGRARMSVAVSAYNTNVAIYPDGRLDRPVESGADFFANGIPLQTTRRDVMAPLLPEAAVVHTARLTKRRIIEVPEFVLLGREQGPLGGGWKLTLERPVRVRTLFGSRTAEVTQLYLGREGGRRLFIAAAEQPNEVQTVAIRAGDPGEIVTVSIPILPGQPTVFEEVAVVPDG